jgi:putative ABC transport system permease protein
MRVLLRGMKNAFRNSIRTLSVTLILALSIGLALVMLLSYQTVQSRIDTVKASVGNTVTVRPAGGGQGQQGGGEPITTDEIAIIKGIANVTNINETLQDRITPGESNNLASAIDPGTLGTRNGQRQQRQFQGGGGARTGNSTAPQTFTIPISVTGVSDPSTLISASSKLTSGDLFPANTSTNVSIVGAGLATKNNLAVGSTFTAYGQAITVIGVYDAGNTFANAGLYMPLTTVQTLSGQPAQVTGVTVLASSIESVDGVVSDIKTKVGSDKVDVTSNKDQAESSIAPLENIKSISLYSLIGALVAGAVITLLIMMMIVRERRREIGVLKAIGSSNVGIVTQFVSEALILTLMGSVVGGILGIALSNPVLSVLVNNTASTAPTGSGGGGGFARAAGQFGGGVRSTITNLHATVGLSVILYGFLAAIVIAIVGSAIPAFLIAKVKPAEVMRAD